MVNWFCAAPDCTISLRKKRNAAKYPGLADVTFHAFPTEKHRRLRQQWISVLRRKDDWSPNNYSRVCSRHFPGNKGPTKEFPVPTLFQYNNWKQPVTVRSTGVIGKLSQHRQDSELHSNSHGFCGDDDCYTPIREVDMIVDDLYDGVGLDIQLGSEDTPSKMYSAVKCCGVTKPPSDHDYISMVDDTTGKPNLDGVSKTRVMPISGETQKRHVVHCEEEMDSFVLPKHCKMTVTCDCETQTDLTGDQISRMSEAADRFNDKDVLRRELLLEKVFESDKSVQNYTGFPNRKSLDGFFGVLDKAETHLKYWSNSSSSKDKKYQRLGKKPGPGRKLTRYQEYILTLIRLRLGLVAFFVGDLFGVSKTRVSQIFTTWISYMAALFESLPWPTRSQIDKHMPPSFKRDFPKTRTVIDCTEFFIEKPRTPKAQITTYSTYKSHNTYKCLVGVTPDGGFNFISKLWGGNVSDKFITAKSGLLDLIEPGDAVMADRGFNIQEMLLDRRAKLIIPAFTRKGRGGKGKRLNVKEIIAARKIARLRIHVERAIGRMKKFRMLSQILPLSMKNITNQMVQVAGGICNFLPPLLRK